MTQPLPPEPIPEPPPPGPILTLTYEEASRLASLLNDAAEILRYYPGAEEDLLLCCRVVSYLEHWGTLRVQPPQPEPQP